MLNGLRWQLSGIEMIPTVACRGRGPDGADTPSIHRSMCGSDHPMRKLVLKDNTRDRGMWTDLNPYVM